MEHRTDRSQAPAGGRTRWLTNRAILAHLALAIWIPGCAVAAWWQVGIALGGDSLGWVYSVMWPCFAVFGAIFWWFLVHDDPESLGARGLRRQQLAQAADGDVASEGARTAGDGAAADTTAAAIAQAEDEDPELARYNAYLAALASQPKTWRRR